MNKKILKLLGEDARMKLRDIADAAGLSEEQAAAEIADMEKTGLIKGYKAVIDWDRLQDDAYVSAVIELTVTPKPGRGFEYVAEKVMKYPEVESVYLMSGSYDLNVVVRARTFQEVALFVAKELSLIDSVTSTSTHFVLRRYKDMNVELLGSGDDDRGNYLL